MFLCFQRCSPTINVGMLSVINFKNSTKNDVAIGTSVSCIPRYLEVQWFQICLIQCLNDIVKVPGSLYLPSTRHQLVFQLNFLMAPRWLPLCLPSNADSKIQRQQMVCFLLCVSCYQQGTLSMSSQHILHLIVGGRRCREEQQFSRQQKVFDTNWSSTH